MILPYTLRLLCLCFASFFLVHASVSLASSIFAPSVIRIGESIKPHLAAWLLLTVRLLPFLCAAFAVAAFCVPSYLWLEPGMDSEHVGIACCATALFGVSVWGISLVRVLRAIFAGQHYQRQFENEVFNAPARGETTPVLVVDSEAPILALVGLIRPRIIVSRPVLRALSHHQLDAAIRHEQAHQFSRDNFKRMLMLFARGILPFRTVGPRLAALDRAWARFIECAADDRATSCDSQRSLSLAEALVRVARLGITSSPSLFMSSLVGDGRDLSVRVNRLLGCRPQPHNSHRQLDAFLGGSFLVAVTLLAAAIARPETLQAVHRLLELFIH